MPTSISNPATFSSVRSAFSTEGYGTSTSFFAYRQGGGIVPDTSEFNAIGAGTAGDPLRLTQFNGFSVPGRVQPLTNHTVDSFRSASGSSIYNSSQALSEIYVSTDGKLYGRGATQYTASFVFAQGHILIDGTDYWADSPPPANPGSDPGPVILQNWLIGSGASEYSCRATITSGTTPDGVDKIRTGSFGSWLAINQIRSWSILVNSNQPNNESPPDIVSMSLIFTLEIAKTSDLSTILASATMTLEAEAVSTNEIGIPV